MDKYNFFISRRYLRLTFSILLICISVHQANAHPMPNSVVMMDIQPKKILLVLQLPLNELELAFGRNINRRPDALVEIYSLELKKYIIAHIHPLTNKGTAWSVNVEGLEVQKVQASPSGPYYELIAKVFLTPPAGSGTRDFVLNYDVILHQVATHFALVSVRQDWEAGLYGEKPVELGVIDWDTRNNVIQPFRISLAGGGAWNGFRRTVALGMHHIAEGSDHLLFLLVLLLPASLLVSGKRWGSFGGVHYSCVSLLKIVTAFTAGHSMTLIAGALGWFSFPVQFVEIVIAFSIIISAVHALRPIFSGRETYIAAGFGLVHGMAFAGTLVSLNLDGFHLGLSILGFNIGIELMQLIVILFVFPWLMILSRTDIYNLVRYSGAIFSAILAVGWMAERITSETNLITVTTAKILVYAPWFIVFLASLALLGILFEKNKKIEMV